MSLSNILNAFSDRFTANHTLENFIALFCLITSVWFFLECVGTLLTNETYGNTLISFFGSIIFFLLGYTQFWGLENLYRISFGVLFLEMSAFLIVDFNNFTLKENNTSYRYILSALCFLWASYNIISSIYSLIQLQSIKK